MRGYSLIGVSIIIFLLFFIIVEIIIALNAPATPTQTVTKVQNQNLPITKASPLVYQTPDLNQLLNYHDSKYNFSIQYPANFQKFTNFTSTTSIYHLYFKQNNLGGNEVDIDIFPNPKQQDITDYYQLEAFKNDRPEWKNTLTPYTKILVDNQDAIRVEHLTTSLGEIGPTAFVAKSDYILKISSKFPTPDNIAVFNKMLATLKFDK